MLGDSSLSNLRLITRELLFMHHQSDPSLCKEFDVRCRFVTEMQFTVMFNAIVFHLSNETIVIISVSVSIYPLWRAGQPQGLWV